MKSKTIIFSGWWMWSLFALLIMILGVSTSQAGEIGKKIIDKSNVQQYKSVLMPALYRAVERGDFILQTGELEFEYKHWNKFLEEGKKNVGKFDVNADGDLIEKSTGKIPYYNIYGFPFPDIDPKDPKMAVKIMWNFQFNKYKDMGYHFLKRVSWIDETRGEHRYLLVEALHMYTQCRTPGEKVPNKLNPDNISLLELGLMQEPFSMIGTNSLAFDFIDKREMITYAYVPVIRRIRQTSGVQRSEPYMGSDSWSDLAYLWGGKNRTMTWKVIGEQTILVPITSTKKIMSKQDPDGTMYLTRPVIEFGYSVPGWKGVSWAPVNVTWVPRKVWIIEQMPKDSYYAWGLHTNYVDQETYQIWMKEVKDKAGQFRTWVIALNSYCEGIYNGNNTVGGMESSLTIDEKVRHATIGRTVNAPGEKSAVYIPQSKMSLNMFSKDTLIALSK